MIYKPHVKRSQNSLQENYVPGVSVSFEGDGMPSSVVPVQFERTLLRRVFFDLLVGLVIAWAAISFITFIVMDFLLIIGLFMK